MITFFRKIRLKLIEKGKLKRYLIYAIGEILLVMVGILLALQVNNWNEENKDRIIEQGALIDLKQEFENNKIRFDHLIKSKQIVLNQNRKFIELISKGNYTAIDLLNGRIGVGDGGIYTFNPSNGVLNSLISTGKIDNISNDSLKYLLTSWNDIIIDYQEEEEGHRVFHTQIFIPFESSLIPQPYIINGDAKMPFHQNDQIENLFKNSIKDLKYQNLILMNERFLNSTIEESKYVNDKFLIILKLLESEIEKRMD